MTLIESPWGVRWSSLAMLAVILVVVTVAKRRPFMALAAGMGWLVSFEAVYEVTDILMHHKGLHAAWGFWLLTVVGWPFFAHALGIRPHIRWVAVAAAIFAVWVEQGFWYNWADQTGPVNWWYEALNVGSKTVLGVAYLLGTLWPERSGWAQTLMLGDLGLSMFPKRLNRSGQVVGQDTLTGRAVQREAGLVDDAP